MSLPDSTILNDAMEGESDSQLPIGLCATLAGQFEATAAKPGNVHRGMDFEDLTYFDLLTCAAVIGPVLEQAPQRRLGETILGCIRASWAAVQTNANLGIVLLLAPLAKVPRSQSLAEGIGPVLADLNSQDTLDVFQAIREAQPGGLGKVSESDVMSPPTTGLIEAMRSGADRDLIARQYAHDFIDVFDSVVAPLKIGHASGQCLAQNIVQVHLQLMSKFPDSLIKRKCGEEIARESADRAAEVLKAAQRDPEEYELKLADLDFWLRSDGHRRNPGTTADMLAAGLFVLLREGTLLPPFRFYEAC